VSRGAHYLLRGGDVVVGLFFQDEERHAAVLHHRIVEGADVEALAERIVGFLATPDISGGRSQRSFRTD
jgi:hypothetical protein